MILAIMHPCQSATAACFFLHFASIIDGGRSSSDGREIFAVCSIGCRHVLVTSFSALSKVVHR